MLTQVFSKMRFLRWKTSQSDVVEPRSSWRSKINPFSRPSFRAASPPEPTTPVEHDDLDSNRYSLLSTPSGLSYESYSPPSNNTSRPPSTMSSISPTSSFGPSFPTTLQRQSSVYSHRSLRIQRDRSRPPPAICPSSMIDRSFNPQIQEEDSLVITSTVC
jgi:hypothetical protein